MRHLPERVIRVAEAALARVGRRVLMRPPLPAFAVRTPVVAAPRRSSVLTGFRGPPGRSCRSRTPGRSISLWPPRVDCGQRAKGHSSFPGASARAARAPNGGELGRQCSDPLDRTVGVAYHCAMRGASAYWTLVFTAASLEHLAERNVEAADVTGAVYGWNGPARVRRGGRGGRSAGSWSRRWRAANS